MFARTRSSTLVFRTERTMLERTVASATTDFPRPSIQFTAAGFLSQQKFPEMLATVSASPPLLQHLTR